MVFSSDLCVTLKILSSEVSVDSDINYLPVVKLLVCLEVYAYLTSNENPHYSTDS